MAKQATASTDGIVVQYDGIEPDRYQSIESSAQKFIEKLIGDLKGDCVWCLSESVWPALTMPESVNAPIKQPLLRLVPLSRIGQMEGKSGSLVLIGYLADKSDPSRLHSHPLVIKTCLAAKDKLRNEYENAKSIKPYAYDQKDSCAIPVYFDDQSGEYHVLWSIYSPASSIWPSVGQLDSHSLVVEDFREKLTLGDERSSDILVNTFNLLRNFHQRFGKASSDSRNLLEEYEPYLRKIDYHDSWQPWKEEWGNGKVIEDAGSKFPNPLKVLERLSSIQCPMFIGAIHGDLHPGNVVLVDGNPRLIDFGWAKDRAHIAKDYVLMECNLRFHTVRPQLKQKDVYVLSDWIEWNEPIPNGLGAYTQQRAQLIKQLRDLASASFPPDTDWDWEYIVPLFLVALGLFRFSPQLGNQQAAVRFTLNLARTVDQLISSREGKENETK
jgi:hypothetical protein